MTLSKSDSATIADLVKLIEMTLDGYDESPYDQIDILRGKLAEFSDILTDSLFNTEEDTSREEALKDIEIDHFNSRV